MNCINKEFESYYIRYRHEIYRIALWITNNHCSAEDIVEETYIALYTHMLHAEKLDNVYPWLIVVAKRKSINLVKATKKFAPYNTDIERAQEIDIANQIFISDMLDCLYQRNKRWYQVIEMHYILGMTTAEVAAELKCTDVSVRNSLYRARKYLRGEYGNIPAVALLILFAASSCSNY